MKTNLAALFIGLALIAGVHQITAQVTNLSIAPVAGGQFLLYWPVSSTNYVLQTTTNLASPNWVTANNAVMVNAATVTNSAPAGYFRLLQSTNPPGMALIPAGWFTMGNQLINDSTITNDPDIMDAYPTNVYVSAFYMDTNLVSSNQWAGVSAYATSHGYRFDLTGAGKGGNNPVSVNWYDVVKWSNARSQQAGLTPMYYTNPTLTALYTNGDVDAVYVNWSANGYRLPTEAEWEKAARGGLSGQRFPWGDTISESQANYAGYTNAFSYDLGPNGYNAVGEIGGSPYTSPVGYFAPNGYGLYDMAGNVFEWCWDWYGTPYGQPTATNPTGPVTGKLRVFRSGSWYDYANWARCAFRNYLSPGVATTGLGFRCVRGL